MRRLLPLLIIASAVLTACEKKFDDKGRLLVKNLESSSGSIRFAPMKRADSASVEAYVPDTFFYKGEPYTGGIAKYNEQNKLILDAHLKDGLLNDTLSFYFASGGLQVQGVYKNGWDLGLWRAYYGYDKVQIEKLYDEHGYLLERRDYYDNGQIKTFQNVHAPQYNDKERVVNYDRKGGLVSLYVEDSIKWEKDAK